MGRGRAWRGRGDARFSTCVHSTRVVFNPSKVKIRVRVPMDASRFCLLIFCILYCVVNLEHVANQSRHELHVWSSLVMTPASHAGNPEFESRHVYAVIFF